jgi:hypothetical protein
MQFPCLSPSWSRRAQSKLSHFYFKLTVMFHFSWLSNQLDVNIEGPSSDAFGNGTCSIAVIVYRDLTEFLPLRYVAKLR